MKKRFISVTVLLIVSLFLIAGCGGDNKAPDNSDNTPEYLEETGTYVGQIDNNSIEIEVKNEDSEDNTFKAFRIDEKAREQLSEITDGDKVSVSYFLNEHEQPVIVSIETIK